MRRALDVRGEPVEAASAERGRLTFCPDCKQEVRLRLSEKRAAHFAHLVGTSCTEAATAAARRRRRRPSGEVAGIEGQEVLF